MSDDTLTLTDPDGGIIGTVPAPPSPPLPPVAPPADTAPGKRPTTRAGRAAASAANKAKKGSQPKASNDKKPAGTTPRKATLETRLAGSLTTLGVAVSMGGGMVSPAFVADGVLICEHAAAVAKALDKVAQDQPHVKAALERMLTAGVYSSLVAALLPIAVGIAANHGAIPPHLAAMFGVAPPADDPEAGGVAGLV